MLPLLNIDVTLNLFFCNKILNDATMNVRNLFTTIVCCQIQITDILVQIKKLNAGYHSYPKCNLCVSTNQVIFYCRVKYCCERSQRVNCEVKLFDYITVCYTYANIKIKLYQLKRIMNYLQQHMGTFATQCCISCLHEQQRII